MSEPYSADELTNLRKFVEKLESGAFTLRRDKLDVTKQQARILKREIELLGTPQSRPAVRSAELEKGRARTSRRASVAPPLTAVTDPRVRSSCAGGRLIVDPNSPETARQVKDLSAAAGELNQRISILNAGSEVEMESVFAVMAEQHVKAALS